MDFPIKANGYFYFRPRKDNLIFVGLANGTLAVFPQSDLLYVSLILLSRGYLNALPDVYFQFKKYKYTLCFDKWNGFNNI